MRSALISDYVHVEPTEEVSAERDFEDRYDRLLERAYFVGWRFFRNQSEAQDVAQEALTRAYARWARVRRHDSPEAWVVRTALNVCLEMGRKRRSFPASGSDQQQADRRASRPTGEEEVAVTRDVLAAAMKNLSKRQRDVVAWRYLFDASVQETSAQLSLTESQVKDATHEAVKKLRRILGEQGPWTS